MEAPMEAPMEVELAGVAEVAAHLGISKQLLGKWRKTSATFPRPLAELRMGPVWDLHAVKAWNRDVGHYI